MGKGEAIAYTTAVNKRAVGRLFSWESYFGHGSALKWFEVAANFG